MPTFLRRFLEIKKYVKILNRITLYNMIFYNYIICIDAVL